MRYLIENGAGCGTEDTFPSCHVYVKLQVRWWYSLRFTLIRSCCCGWLRIERFQAQLLHELNAFRTASGFGDTAGHFESFQPKNMSAYFIVATCSLKLAVLLSSLLTGSASHHFGGRSRKGTSRPCRFSSLRSATLVPA